MASSGLSLVVVIIVFVSRTLASDVEDFNETRTLTEEVLQDQKQATFTELHGGSRQDFVWERGSYEGGDMAISSEQKNLMQKDELFKSGIIGQRYRWPNGKIFVSVDSAFNNRERSLIQQSMKEIEERTCIRFAWRQRNSHSWVYIRRGGYGSGCWSWVGRQGGGQVLTLQPPGCLSKGTIIHELMHAIGFFHEQARPDRDGYVKVNWRNIPRNQMYNFEKLGRNYVDTQGFPYDYKSIMHYTGYAFALNRRWPTLYPMKRGMTSWDLGQNVGLTELDIKKINHMYKGICH